MLLACHLCAISAADLVLPPVTGWLGVGALWLVATAVLMRWRRRKVPGAPGIVGSILLVILVAIAIAEFSVLGLAAGLLFFYVPPFRVFLFCSRKPQIEIRETATCTRAR